MNPQETPLDLETARAMHKLRASALYERVATAMDSLGVLRGTLLAIASTRMAPTDSEGVPTTEETAFATWTALEAAVAGLESVAERVREQGDALAATYRDVSGTGMAAAPSDTSRDNLARLIQQQRASLMALNQQIDSAESTLRDASDNALRLLDGKGRSEEELRSGAVELQDVNEFLQQSPLASVPVNATYFQRILEAARSKEGHKRPMGAILKAAGLITARQLEKALARQKKGKKRPLGALLVDLGYTTDVAIAQTIAAQLALPFIVLAKETVRAEALAAIPLHLARRHCCFPMQIYEGSITVAMANPLDLIALEDLRLASGKHVRPGVASRAEISRHIDRHYGASSA